MSSHIKRVAVIGAGPAGAIAVDALAKEQAFDSIRVFDRRSRIGGAWVYTPHLPAQIPSLKALLEGSADDGVSIPSQTPAVTPLSEAVNGHQVRFSDTAIHENLHSNITPALMSYSQEPFPDSISDHALAEYGRGAPFRHHSVIRDWIEEIFRRGGHDKALELNTAVERAVKDGNDWVLTLRKETRGENYWWEERFDALVVATGHYNVPWFPEIPGLLEYNARFPGRIVHSKHFRGPSKFAGKRVVVIGGSVSSHEIIHEILHIVKAPVYASIKGEPIPAFGWTPFDHPRIAVRKGISRLDPDTGRVFFADGSHLDDIDHIIFGTGYTFSVPFLPEKQNKIKKTYRRLPGVWQHTWDIEDPSLVFVGMLGGGFTFRVYEWQAVAVARYLAGRARPLPSKNEQLQWERERVLQKRGGKDYYSIAPDYASYFELLRDIAGNPAPGTTGRVLPPFDKRWMDVWTGMTATKIASWERNKKKAEESKMVGIRAKL